LEKWKIQVLEHLSDVSDCPEVLVR
jgi:hypothetical protein